MTLGFLTVSLVALYSFFSFSLAIRDLSGESIPSIVAGSNTINHISNLMSETERLASSRVISEQRIAYGNITKEFESLRRLTRGTVHDNDELNSEIDLLSKTIAEFNELIISKVLMISESEKQFLKLSAFTDELILFQKSIQASEYSAVVKADMYYWSSRMMSIVNDISRIISINTMYKIKKLENSLMQDFGTIDQYGMLFPEKLMPQKIQFENTLKVFLFARNSLISVKKQSVNISLRTNSRANFLRNLVEEFKSHNNAKYNEIVSLAAEKSLDTNDRVNVLVYAFSTVLLIFFVAVVGVIIYLRSYVTLRLTKLNSSILARLSGDDTAPICIEGKDEITDMAQSFVYYENEVKKRELELKDLAMKDALTGISNRRHFMEQAEAEFKRSSRYEHDMIVLMIDIDHFKNINDTYGHHAGDMVLKGVAGKLSDMLRESDLLGRIGGEEFAVVLLETGLEEGVLTAERLREEISHTDWDAGSAQLRCTVSIGATSICAGDDTLNAMLKRADDGLYESKESGRNRVSVR